jgi:uncharacterized membrane protein YfcA
VIRPGGKGTNFTFTEFLAKTSLKFRNRIGVTSSPEWPAGDVAERSSDMVEKVKATTGAIGYVEYQYAASAAGKTGAVDDLRAVSWTAVAVCSFIDLLVAIYGGYFGAGIGFITLGMLAALGMRDIHAMGAIRTLLAATINAVAVLTFVVAGAVLWRQCVVMIAGALTGGWFGAHYAQKADPRRVRAVVIGLGAAMTVYFFITIR